VAANGSMTWLGHAALRLSLPDGRVILIDPWLQENPACPKDQKVQPRCEYVVLTHGHFDHVGDTAELVAQHDPHIVAPVELCTILGRDLPHAKFCPMNIGGTQRVDGVDLVMTQAFHSSSVTVEGHPVYAGMPTGILVKAPGLAVVYHAGDTDVFGDMALISRLHRPAVAALPIGDHYTMGPKGAALAIELLDPQVVLPMHYATFPVLTGVVQALRDALDEKLAGRVLNISPGQTVNWTLEGVSAPEPDKVEEKKPSKAKT
jgi:L-ascorbate metabolism protein UlaG (beta-lactamase superfamily)